MVVVVGLMQAAIAAVADMMKVRVVGVVMHAAVKVGKTEPRLVLVKLTMGKRAPVMDMQHVVMVGLMLNTLVFVPANV